MTKPFQERLLEVLLVMERSDKYIQKLVASEAIPIPCCQQEEACKRVLMASEKFRHILDDGYSFIERDYSS